MNGTIFRNKINVKIVTNVRKLHGKTRNAFETVNFIRKSVGAFKADCFGKVFKSFVGIDTDQRIERKGARFPMGNVGAFPR